MSFDCKPLVLIKLIKKPLIHNYQLFILELNINRKHSNHRDDGSINIISEGNLTENFCFYCSLIQLHAYYNTKLRGQ